MERIVIIGNAGGGKTTLARALSDKLDLSLHLLDSVQWQPGWKLTPLDELENVLKGWMAEEKWIVEGFGPMELMPLRFKNADTIIYLDLPLSQHISWALKRQIQFAFKNRPELPPNSPTLPMSWEIIKALFKIHYKLRPQLLKMLETEQAIKKVIWIRSKEVLEKFLKEL
jgi:adenylate kinase family enzyme